MGRALEEPELEELEELLLELELEEVEELVLEEVEELALEDEEPELVVPGVPQAVSRPARTATESNLGPFFIIV